MPADSILVVDDDRALAETLCKSLRLEGYRATAAFGGREAAGRVAEDPMGFGLALLDLRLPDVDGLELLKDLRGINADLACVVLSAHGTVQAAVEAMRLGAQDFLVKPFPREKLLATVARGLERSRLVEENRMLRERLRREHAEQGPVGRSAAFARSLDLIRSVAPTEATVLLTGETGTGKEHAAALVHRWSRRADGPFLSVNCAALAESLLESQLFGHVKGAFSGAYEARRGLFEEARGGTLFLDEIGDVSPSLQVKLLRVLEEREFLPVGAPRPRKTDVRIVAATNRDLKAEVGAGRFREDLYYRLHVFQVVLAPLRERVEDIDLLAQVFVVDANRRLGRSVRGFRDQALGLLRAHSWPGNVRELRNEVERCVILCPGEWIGPELVSVGTGGSAARGNGFLWPEQTFSLRQVEGAYVAEVLRRTRWHKSASAEALGIGRKTLDRKIREHGLQRPGALP